MVSSQEVIYIGFNQDSSCITLSTENSKSSESENGFRVVSTDPLKCCFQRGIFYLVFPGSFSIVELLSRSNIIALVGGGRSPRYPASKLYIWDDHQLCPIAELCFRGDIKSVKLRSDRVVVVLEHKIYVYNLRDLKVRDCINTCPNPRGLCCISTEGDREVLVCPDIGRGNALVKLYNEEKRQVIEAHETSLACMALTRDGGLLATASDKGTLIRIFDTETMELKQELRRGIDRAEIFCLAFHPSNEWIACSSDKGTIHIYSIDPAVANPKLGLHFFKKVLPKYFDSQWSYAHFKIKDAKTICAFLADRQGLMVVTDDGMYYEVTFVEGGQCVISRNVSLLEVDML